MASQVYGWRMETDSHAWISVVFNFILHKPDSAFCFVSSVFRLHGVRTYHNRAPSGIDVLVLAVTWTKTAKLYKEARQQNFKAPLVTMLFRDGMHVIEHNVYASLTSFDNNRDTLFHVSSDNTPLFAVSEEKPNTSVLLSINVLQVIAESNVRFLEYPHKMHVFVTDSLLANVHLLELCHPLRTSVSIVL